MSRDVQALDPVAHDAGLATARTAQVDEAVGARQVTAETTKRVLPAVENSHGLGCWPSVERIEPFTAVAHFPLRSRRDVQRPGSRTSNTRARGPVRLGISTALA